MKIRKALRSLVLSGLCLCLDSACSTSQTQLLAQAKVGRSRAEQIALAKVPNGVIKGGELEKENGKLIWSFDIARPGTKDITEIQIDAMTGEVASIENETPEQQAKESEKDAKESKTKK
jgi:hypothetical protein